MTQGIDEFIEVAEVNDELEAADALFQRKYRLSMPAFPHHVVVKYRAADGSTAVACYIHFTDCGDLMLGGGACTDERVLRRMDAAQRQSVRDAGGLYLHALRWSVRHFGPRVCAILGYCGDALAERLDRAAGFESTAHAHLLVYWTREVDDNRRAQIIAKANSFTPF